MVVCSFDISLHSMRRKSVLISYLQNRNQRVLTNFVMFSRVCVWPERWKKVQTHTHTHTHTESVTNARDYRLTQDVFEQKSALVGSCPSWSFFLSVFFLRKPSYSVKCFLTGYKTKDIEWWIYFGWELSSKIYPFQRCLLFSAMHRSFIIKTRANKSCFLLISI